VISTTPSSTTGVFSSVVDSLEFVSYAAGSSPPPHDARAPNKKLNAINVFFII